MGSAFLTLVPAESHLASRVPREPAFPPAHDAASLAGRLAPTTVGLIGDLVGGMTFCRRNLTAALVCLRT